MNTHPNPILLTDFLFETPEGGRYMGKLSDDFLVVTGLKSKAVYRLDVSAVTTAGSGRMVAVLITNSMRGKGILVDVDFGSGNGPVRGFLTPRGF